MTGNIFISYRRSGDWSYARLLYGELEKKYPPAQIFMDVDSIAPGEDFVRLLNEKVAQTDIFLTVIGPAWLDSRSKDDKRRLDDPEDFVRIEIEQALKTRARIIPLLVEGATMPDPRSLPESMRGLCNRNAVRLSQDRFRTDAQQLMITIESALKNAADERHRDDEAWETAARENTPDALRRYLSTFPNGRHAEEATARQSTLAQQERPGLTPEQIKTAEELANWQFIEKRGREAEMRQHLLTFPRGATARMARAMLDEMVWKRIATTNDVAAFDAYLAEFPEGEYAQQARKQRDILRAPLVYQEIKPALPPLGISAPGSHGIRSPLAQNAGLMSSLAPGIGVNHRLGPLIIGGFAVLIYALEQGVGLLAESPLGGISLSSTYTYRYNPFIDIGATAGLALGLGMVAGIGWRMALLAFVALEILVSLFDLGFNMLGASMYASEGDFYGGTPLGLAVWIPYYAFYAVTILAGLSLFSRDFRNILPWLALPAAGAITQLIANPLSTTLSSVHKDGWIVGAVAAPIIIAVAAGWFMRRQT